VGFKVLRDWRFKIALLAVAAAATLFFFIRLFSSGDRYLLDSDIAPSQEFRFNVRATGTYNKGYATPGAMPQTFGGEFKFEGTLSLAGEVSGIHLTLETQNLLTGAERLESLPEILNCSVKRDGSIQQGSRVAFFDDRAAELFARAILLPRGGLKRIGSRWKERFRIRPSRAALSLEGVIKKHFSGIETSGEKRIAVIEVELDGKFVPHGASAEGGGRVSLSGEMRFDLDAHFFNSADFDFLADYSEGAGGMELPFLETTTLSAQVRIE